MKRIVFFWLACLLSAWLAPLSAEEYRGVFWNLESGESDDQLIGQQLAAKGQIDFFGLSEVEGQAALDAYVAALKAAFPAHQYASKLSEEGGSDRLAVIYRTDRLKSVPYGGTAAVDDLGDNFFEIDAINLSGTLRPALGVQLESKSGQQVIVLVNHFKAFGSGSRKRADQATLMSAFALRSTGVPIIAGGDFNIPIRNGSATEEAFQILTRTWEYKTTPHNIGTHASGSILDSVFVTNKIDGWESKVSVLDRSGSAPASSKNFNDDADETDHRPLLVVVESDTEESIESIREAIAATEAELQRLKRELQRLEGSR